MSNISLAFAQIQFFLSAGDFFESISIFTIPQAMKKFDSKLYAKVAASATGVSLLSTSPLEAIFSGSGIGALGVDVPATFEVSVGDSDTPSVGTGGTKRVNAFGFDAAGQYAIKNSGYSGGFSPIASVKFKTYDNFSDGTAVYDYRFAYVGDGSFNYTSIGKERYNVGDSVGPGDKFTGFPFVFAEQAGEVKTIQEGLLGVDRGIVGFRLETDVEGSYRYGWFDLQVDADGLTVFGFGLSEGADTALTIVPEVKQAALLLGLGAAGMAAYRRRRRAV